MAFNEQDRVKVINRNKQGYDRSGTVVRVAYDQIFIRFDGDPGASMLPYAEGDLMREADPRRGGKAIGRFRGTR